tara:strand:+ start:1313 stop:1624 length:312 start_codon:yes stop_codon:yes gene_type:complete
MNEINFNEIDLSKFEEVSQQTVEKENELKTFLIEYVGKKEKPDNDEVTVEMIVNTMAQEFPEFVLTVAEENWIRGYQQAMVDVEVGERLVEEELNKTKEDEQP